MKTGTKVLIAVAAVVVLLALLVIGGYNGLVSKNEEVERQYSEIDNQLQRRSDLIPNLVATVKQYAAHETAVFTAVSDARARLVGASSRAEQADADAGSLCIVKAAGHSRGLSELKANENFINLQDELAGTENRIANARRYYNEGGKLQHQHPQVPTNIIANLFGEGVEYFQASEGNKENPDVGDLFN